MGIFSKEKMKPRDMADANREQWINNKIREQNNNRVLPADLIPPEPPVSVQKQQPVEVTETEYIPIRITIVLNAKNKELIVQMIDGISEIVNNFGIDCVQDFKIEKILKED